MSWEFLQRWYMPFAWLTLSSLISVPAAIYFQAGMHMQTGSEVGLAYGNDWVRVDDFLATIVVYGLNLGAVLWLFNADGSTRWAAFWCSIVAVARIITPVALATLSDVPVGAERYIDWNTLRILVWFQDFQMFVMGIMLWMAFARFVGESNTLLGSSHAEYSHA